MEFYQEIITRLVITIVILQCVYAPATGHSDEEPILHRSRRVVGGIGTDVDEVPYLVNIRRNGVFVCGGSLITPRCVLTAAHCAKDDAQPEDFVVRGGVTFLNHKINKRQVENIILPHKYDKKTFTWDIAIFELQSELQLGHNIDVISLAEYPVQPGQYLRISGWGLTNETSMNPSNRMQSTQVEVHSNDECLDLYKDYRNVTEAMFCASIPGQSDACMADSGGPAVTENGHLAGVVSWGRRRECGRFHSPGVYVRISEVIPWINNVMKKYCY